MECEESWPWSCPQTLSSPISACLAFPSLSLLIHFASVCSFPGDCSSFTSGSTCCLGLLACFPPEGCQEGIPRTTLLPLPRREYLFSSSHLSWHLSPMPGNLLPPCLPVKLLIISRSSQRFPWALSSDSLSGTPWGYGLLQEPSCLTFWFSSEETLLL